MIDSPYNEKPVYYQDTRTGWIQEIEQWEKMFYQMNDPCKWYNCSGDCDETGHGDYLDPSDCFLVEVEMIGLDHEGAEIWEKV